jgi:hypothetical protein
MTIAPAILQEWIERKDDKPSYCTQTFAEIMDLMSKPHQSWVVEVSDGSGFAANGLRFATAIDGIAYANDLFGRWFGAQEYRLALSDEAPNR